MEHIDAGVEGINLKGRAHIGIDVRNKQRKT
jgi:hypothetical protein